LREEIGTGQADILAESRGWFHNDVPDEIAQGMMGGRYAAIARNGLQCGLPARDAFDTTRRLLEDHVREARGDVKMHTVPDHGRIARLLPEQNCGFILSADGPWML
jgi:hypothetical protein